jgi:hypothetical protein
MMGQPPRLSLLVMFALACGSHADGMFRIAVAAESDPGKPLAGARIALGGKELARTDTSGRAALALHGRAGDVVELAVDCPAGHAAPARPLSVVLRPLAEPSRVPEYKVLCAPLVRSLVVAVRAERGAHLPLKYLGREVARTDAAGAAHVLLEVEPNRPVSLTLDTSAAEHARLRPQNPELKLMMPAHDEVALFEQSFTLAEVDKPRRRPPPAPRGPTRITLPH